jgi:glycosyltransferase involved in cell wall biosynthesis
MNNKPEIVFTFPACMGGVASFNFNIINNSQLIARFYSKVILIKALEDKRPLFLDTFKADEVITFNYSYKENQYYVRKRLNKLLGNCNGAIVTDNALTVTAAGLFKNPKTIFHLVHDYFYVNEVIHLGDLADVVVAHSSFFSDAVFASNPVSFGNRCFYIPYGVVQLKQLPIKKNKTLKLVFLGRLDEGKGVMHLFEIEKGLQAGNIGVNWTIIGKGPLKDSLLSQWNSNSNVSFYEPDSTEAVYKLLQNQDVFVFPTNFEGTPVSILECLANGVVTITHDLPGGIRDVVTEGIGFRCALNDTSPFIERIKELNNNPGLLQQMQQNCFKLAADNYDIGKNADNYFDLFLKYEILKRKTKINPVKVSRLDKAIFPNVLVKLIRSIK